MTTTLDEALQKTSIKPRVLISIEPRAKIEGWFLTEGKTYTYESNWSERRPSNVQEDDTDLTEKSSINEVEAASGSWYWDSSAGKVYVHTTGDDNPANYTILLEVVYRFCGQNDGILEWDGHFWEPLISSMPTIADSVPDLFYSQTKYEQVSFSLINSEGFFDIISQLFYWENAFVKIYYGVAGIDFTDFAIAFIGIMKDPAWALDEISFVAIDLRLWLEEQIPRIEYSQEIYPDLADEDDGKSMPIVYGPWSYFPVTKISVTPRKYKIAGHRLNAITAVRIDGTPTETGNYTTNLPIGEFTLNIDPGTSEVTVDIEGKHNGIKYLEAGVDQARDLLAYSTIPTDLINENSFVSAAEDNPAKTRLAAKSKTNISALLSILFRNLFLLFYFDGEGKLSLKAWKPEIPETSLKFEESDFVTEPSAESATDEIYYKVDIAYDRDYTDSESKHFIVQDDISSLIYKKRKIIEIDSAALINYEDAQNATNYYLFVAKSRSLKIKATLGPRAMQLKIGDKIRLNYSRAPHLSGEFANRYFEVTGYSKNLDLYEVSLGLGDMKGLGSDLCVIAANDHPDWEDSTEQQRDSWGYIGDPDGFVDPEKTRKKFII